MTDTRYIPKIPKADLKDGAYYYGHCRNASIARWNARDKMFYYRRTKFGHSFIETINHPEDDNGFDLFVVEREVDRDVDAIPFPEEK